MITETIKNNVRKLLENFPATRDCDMKLVSMYWWKYDDCITIHHTLIYHSGVTHFESIRRIRQKLQADFPELRGLRYRVRKTEKEPEMREMMRDDKKDSRTF